jgi:hypothetical protein
MKIFLTILAAMWAVGAMWAAEKAQPTMPDEVTLTSGRVLKKVSVVRWEKDRVVLKYAGGVEPIHFSLIKSISPEELRAIQTEDRRVASLPPPAPKVRVIRGQVFVTTMGAGSYKFAGAHVRAYPLDEFESMKGKQVARLPSDYRRMSYEKKKIGEANAWIDALSDLTPTAETTTDADSNYELKLPPKRECFLVCTAGRIAGRESEQNTWVITIPSTENRVDMNNSNQWKQPE